MADSLSEAYERNRILLVAAAAALEHGVRDALEGVPHVDRVIFRAKETKSFVAKAQDQTVKPPYSSPLVEIEDQIAGRVLVFGLPDIEKITERLSGTFTYVESSRRRPAKDEEFGYETHHVICMIPPEVMTQEWRAKADELPTTFELQIRTLFMHAWAEPQHDLAYKASADLPPRVRRELAWVAASAWGADQAFERVWEWHATVTAEAKE
jgi:putative GTP pyrophosphokinase